MRADARLLVVSRPITIYVALPNDPNDAKWGLKRFLHAMRRSSSSSPTAAVPGNVVDGDPVYIEASPPGSCRVTLQSTYRNSGYLCRWKVFGPPSQVAAEPRSDRREGTGNLNLTRKSKHAAKKGHCRAGRELSFFQDLFPSAEVAFLIRPE